MQTARWQQDLESKLSKRKTEPPFSQKWARRTLSPSGPKRPPLSSREEVQSTHGTEGLLDCFLDGPSEINLNSWCQEKSTKVQEWCYLQWFVARSPRSNQHLQWPSIYAKDVMIWRTYVWSEARTSYQTPTFPYILCRPWVRHGKF